MPIVPAVAAMLFIVASHTCTEKLYAAVILFKTILTDIYISKISALFINIHSHAPAQPGEWAIQTLYSNFSSVIRPGTYAAGLHPWHIHETRWKQEFEALQSLSKQEQVIAIGECGLDKACNTPFQLQKDAFIAQLLWANEINKPLIIHCVRAFDEILKLLQIHKNKVPVIFHGFNKNRLLAEKLTAKGHWLSFGKALLQAGNHENFLSVPADKYFLETDDAAVSIEIIYKAAANIKNTTVDELHLQLKKNVRTVFNISV